MFPLVSRSCVGVLFLLQTFQPVMAWDWYVAEEPCYCEVDWDCCESDVVIEDAVIESETCGCESAPVVFDECGCGSEAVDTVTSEPAKQPEPAQSNKPQAQSEPKVETPQPVLDTEDHLPPAPINVPTTPPATEPEGDELFPRPATEPAETEPEAATPTHPVPTDVVPPTTPTEVPKTPADDAGSLFDEPAVESTPAPEPAVSQPAPAAADTSSPSAPPVGDIFGESAPSTTDSSASESAVEEKVDEKVSNETKTPDDKDAEQPTSDPLDDLFGPSSAIEQPAINHHVIASMPAASRIASGEFRQWSSRNNDFHCQGQLIRVATEGVFIAQPNGDLVAIAYSQLSDADLAFVRSHVQAQRALLAQQEADSQIASRNVP